MYIKYHMTCSYSIYSSDFDIHCTVGSKEYEFLNSHINLVNMNHVVFIVMAFIVPWLFVNCFKLQCIAYNIAMRKHSISCLYDIAICYMSENFQLCNKVEKREILCSSLKRNVLHTMSTQSYFGTFCSVIEPVVSTRLQSCQ